MSCSGRQRYGSTGATHPQLGQPLAIRLVNLNIVDPLFPGSDLEVDFDDVRLSADTTTPSVPLRTWPLAAGLLGLGWLALQRHNARTAIRVRAS